MNLVSLQYFVEVAKELNITNTAKRLFVSQQCLSLHIQRLEHYYGIELFHRKPRLSLTYAGEQLVIASTRILSEEAELAKRISEISGSGVGCLKLGIPTYRAQICLPLVLPKFHNKWPKVTIQLSELSSQEMEHLILEGQLDLYIGIQSIENPLLVYYPMMTDDVYLVVSDAVLEQYYGDKTPELKKKAREGVDLKDFSKLPYLLVSHPNRLRKVADECFREVGYQPNIYIESANTDMLISLYPNDFGAFFLSRMGLPLLRNVVPEANIFPLLHKGTLIKHQVIIAHHKDRYLPPYAKDFINMILPVYEDIADHSGFIQI